MDDDVYWQSFAILNEVHMYGYENVKPVMIRQKSRNIM